MKRLRSLLILRAAAIAFIATLNVVPNDAFAKDREFRAPRLPNGQVNLQGVWANNNLTPLERPREFTTAVITAAQAKEFQTKFEARIHNPNAPSDPPGYEEPRVIEPIGGELRSSLIVEPQDGQIPRASLFKEKTVAHFKVFPLQADGPEQRIATERCLTAPNAVAPMMSFPGGELHQFIQTDNSVIIATEFNHDTRIIRLNAKHNPAAITSWLGDSIGWWEGATLVVETKYFSAASELRFSPGVLFYISPQATVTERFTMLSNAELKYVFTVDDPIHYTSAWTGEDHFTRSHEPLLEYACHEGNYSLTNILQGARVQDGQLSQPK